MTKSTEGSHMPYSKLPSLYQQMIHLSRYARWVESQGRREAWEETVDRYVGHMVDLQCKGKIPKETREEIRRGILALDVMPSMRGMMTAGKALEVDHVAGYNCAYVAIDDMVAFSEMLYILMCFHPDTEVRVKGGVKKISEITLDDMVESRDMVSGETVYCKPSRVLCNPTEKSEKTRLVFDDGSEVVCTEDHLFLTKNRGWVKACELSEEDEL